MVKAGVDGGAPRELRIAGPHSAARQLRLCAVRQQSDGAAWRLRHLPQRLARPHHAAHQREGYSAIQPYTADANSNYNALQLHATKRKGALVFTTSYTWSKALTDASGFDESARRTTRIGATTTARRATIAATSS